MPRITPRKQSKPRQSRTREVWAKGRPADTYGEGARAHDMPLMAAYPRNPSGGRALCSRGTERDIDQETKHEIAVLTLGTLAAIPVVTSIGLVVVTGLLAW